MEGGYSSLFGGWLYKVIWREVIALDLEGDYRSLFEWRLKKFIRWDLEKFEKERRAANGASWCFAGFSSVTVIALPALRGRGLAVKARSAVMWQKHVVWCQTPTQDGHHGNCRRMGKRVQLPVLYLHTGRVYV